MKLPSIRTLRKYHRITEVGEITRRYFALNAFDGVITILGVLVGSYFGQIRNTASVITLGLATAFAMGVSGFYGAYIAEQAERKRALAELEASTLSSLRGTELSDAATYAAVAVSLVNGLSPSAAAFLAISPFFLGDLLSIEVSFVVSFIIAFTELFAVGAYLGTVSKTRVVLSGIRMVAVGLLCVAVGYALGVTA
ncbi:MAG: VIT1/CCC1 transporter family protein [Thermoleophilia bacterium]